MKVPGWPFQRRWPVVAVARLRHAGTHHYVATGESAARRASRTMAARDDGQGRWLVGRGTGRWSMSGRDVQRLGQFRVPGNSGA